MHHLKVVSRVSLSAVLLGLVATAAFSQPVTTPPGLNPGDQYRLAFVTSSAIANATSGSISTYDTHVTTVANSQAALLALGTTWKAIGSTASVDARDNTGTNPAATGVPIYLLNGARLADDNVDLWDGTVDTPLAINEAGNPLAGVLVWTGTQSSGIKGAGGFFGPLGSGAIIAGSTSVATAGWIFAGGYDPNGPMPLYGMSGVLTVVDPSVPPTITKAFGAAVIGLDNPVTSMTITISNPGVNTSPLTGVGFTDTFPAGLVVATPNAQSNTCGGTATATAGSGSLTLSGGTLAVGASCTVSINVRATSLGTKVNTTGAVTSNEGGSGLTATASIIVGPTVPALGPRELAMLAVLLAVLGAFALGSKVI